eukprot:384654_1
MLSNANSNKRLFRDDNQINDNYEPSHKKQKLSNSKDSSVDSFDGYASMTCDQKTYVKYTRYKKKKLLNINSELELHAHLKQNRGNLFVPIPIIKDYLTKRNDILFPINDKMCILIGNAVDYLGAEILELAGNNCKDQKEELITPQHMFNGIVWDDELKATFTKQLLQLMYPTRSIMCHRFYHFIDKTNTNNINYKQFFNGIKQIGLYHSNDTDNDSKTIIFKQLFDNIDIENKNVLSFENWKQYFNKTVCYGQIDTMTHTFKWFVTVFIVRCSILFDALCTSEDRDDVLDELGYSNDNPFAQTYLVQNEIKDRMNIIFSNIYKYINSETDSSVYHHNIRPKNNHTNDNTKYFLYEIGLYKIIFGYLLYEDILNGVYEIDGIIHKISLTVLDEKYPMFVYCKLLNNSLYEILNWVQPTLEIRQDCIVILGALLMDMMNRIIKQVNVKYKEKNENGSINECCIDDLQEIILKCNFEGELSRFGCIEPTKTIKEMMLFKSKDKNIVITDEIAVKDLFVLQQSV